ncbi:MAG TPA: NF038122 family metalloprotease [Pyrinomonadaceae bacterium]|nr:NF038122 family metalloprotease [Pyrinomonadaceae bacterium]
MSFPLSAFRLTRPSLTNLRTHVSAVLMLVMFLAPMLLRTSAQTGTPSAKVPQGDHFVFYRGPNGEFSCRVATLQEARELEQMRPEGLRQITHVKADASLKGENATAYNVDNLTIILRATATLDANAPAKAAFIRAAQIWEAQIKSPITIYLDVHVGPQQANGNPWSSGTIGSTSSPAITAGYQTVRNQLIAGASTGAETTLYNSLPSSALPTNVGDVSSTSVSLSIARAIGLADATAQPGDSAANIGFNSNFNFDYDPNDGIQGTDFEAVAVHEIGHALGFTSGAGSTTPLNPRIWDIFRFRTGTTLGTFGTAQRIMTADGLQYYFSGPPELGLSTGGPNGEAPGGDGRQSSHWKDDALTGGNYIGIMDPTIGSNVRRQITANDTVALDSFGYNLSNNNPPPPPPPPPPVPANNDFANAQVIAGCSGTVTGTNIGANKETGAGEPSHSPDGNAGGGSVWYHWQAPSSGSVTIKTQGSTYDTLLAIYTGNSVGGLTSIAKNDDVDLGNILHSQVTFDVTAGTIYKIAVDGWGGDTGSVTLNWTQSGCSQSSLVQLGHLSYSAAEANGSVQVFFTRTDSSAAGSVDYATSDPAGLAECNVKNGVASSRCDYATSIGTIRFAAGESLKSLFIPLTNDSYAEGTENFTISITNPVGATLGPVTSVTIAIQDNESSDGSNPLDTTAFFVEQHYIDFLGRNPEPAGKTAWMSILNGCPPSGIDGNGNFCDRIEVSAGFFRSPEFQSRGYFIYRFYSAVGSIPVYEQFTPDFGRVSGFLSDAQLEANKVAFVNDFMSRTAFQNKYSSTFSNPTAYVDALLATVGLPGHPSRVTWINQLNANNTSQTRGEVLRALVESQQVYDKYYNEAFVIMQYFGYLRRTADASYLNWIQTMNQTNGDYRIMINGFMNSAEYRKRFGP